MSVPLGNVNGRNLVIASVGTSVEPSINYQESQEMPTERPNGGDLLHGDLWYNDVEDVLYIFTYMGWSPVGLQKDYVDAIGQDLSERITNLDTLCASLEDRIIELETLTATKDYVDAIGQDLSERILQLDTLCASLEEKIDEQDRRLLDGGL